MSTLTVTAKGQVTLRKDVLEHLGVHPGEKITVNKLPDGRIEVKAARPTGKISDVFGIPEFLEKRWAIADDRGNEQDRRARVGRQAMKITADTNVLVRAITEDLKIAEQGGAIGLEAS